MLKTATVNPDITEMPRFNKSIQVTVELDSVFQKMLDLLPADYKHREVLAHAIVGSAAEAGTLQYIFAGLNGYTNDIDFSLDDVVMCSEKERYEWYDSKRETETGQLVADEPLDLGTAEYKPDLKRRSVSIGECKIVEINLYKKDKLKVQFQTAVYGSSGRIEVHETWVSHKNCQFVPQYKDVVS